MGEAIDKTDFSSQEDEQFYKNLREETKILKNIFESRAFEYNEKPCFGLEVEAWLVDKNCMPSSCCCG